MGRNPLSFAGESAAGAFNVDTLESRLLLSVDPAIAARLEADGFASMLWQGQETYARPGEWIVRLDGLAGAPAKQLQAANALLSRTPLKLQAQRQLGGDGLFLVQAPGNAAYEHLLGALSKVPGFKYVEPNFAVWATGAIGQAVYPVDDPRYSELWGLGKIDAPDAWPKASGSNVVVAVIDTGVDYTHPDLSANIWTNPGEIAGNGIDDDGNGFIDDVRGWDFANRDNNPMDDNGHGTHVSGTIAAVDNYIGVIGVAPNARIMALKFLTASGSGATADAIAAVNYAAAKGASVINASWGGGEYSQGLYDAIAATAARDMLFIAAAGNGNAANKAINTDIKPFYPASYNLDNIIAVAATDQNDVKASFSNYGAVSVDLGAPGVNILSTLPGGSYGSYSGTSMATPHVSGVAALAYSYGGDLSYAEVRKAIFSNVDAVPSLAGKTVTGGRLNASKTLQSIQPPSVSAPAAPDGLAASVTHDSVVLSWIDASQNEAGFRVERSADGQNSWATIGSVAANITTFTDAPVEPNTTYAYRVVAFNSGGEAASGVLEVTTDEAPPPDPNQGTGLTGRYYDYSTNNTRKTPDPSLAFGKLLYTQTDAQIDFAWGSGSPTGLTSDTFAIRWTGRIRIDVADVYSFTACSDDGVRLWIDGMLVIDAWRINWGELSGNPVSLVAGMHNIQLDYFENTGDALIRLDWQRPGLARQAIPTNVLYPDTSAPIYTAGSPRSSGATAASAPAANAASASPFSTVTIAGPASLDAPLLLSDLLELATANDLLA